MKKLLLLLLIGAIPAANGMAGVPDKPKETQEEAKQELPPAPQEELDPILRLRMAYANQKKAARVENPEKPEEETPKKPQVLFDLAKNFVFDTAISYAIGYYLHKRPANQELLKDSLFEALRIPSILDKIYRIPFKLIKPEEETEGYEIARTFAEDVIVGYAVNYSYQKIICGRKVDHLKFLASSALSACRLPFIAESIIRYNFL